MEDTTRPHTHRKFHQRVLGRQRRRRRRRRQIRIRRLRLLRALRSAKFWSRASVGSALALCIVFWARFAFVYDVPTFLRTGPLTGVSAYIVVKPWWFGPPVFDLGAYATLPGENAELSNPRDLLMTNLGHYLPILLTPSFVWMDRMGP